jgi:DNA-directed RNA polymerase II subunit RPB1
VCQLKTDIIYEKNVPVQGGLSDLRMGTVERFTTCTTDSADERNCPGYFGHLELAKPMYHCGFIKAVVAVLRCVAYDTSQILLDPVRVPKSSPQGFTSCVLRGALGDY